MQLGCDARGYSRAGYDTVTWYCAVVAGRHSPELSNMRGVSVFHIILFHNIALIFGSRRVFRVGSVVGCRSRSYVIEVTWVMMLIS